MKRIQWLDFAKGLLIFIVVMIHALAFPPICYILDIFVMPVFFAISGYLYKNTDSFKKYFILLYKKCTSFLIPYFFFTFFDIIILHLTKDHNVLDNLHYIYTPYAYLWFLYALFFIFIIVGFLDVINVNLYVQVSFSVLLLLISMLLPWQINGHGDVNPIASIGEYMLCFYIGYIIKRFHYISKLKSCFIYLGLGWIILLFIQVHFTGIYNYDPDLFNYSNVCTKLLSIPLFFSLFINFKRNTFFKYFDKYGKYTLLIYLVHVPVIQLIIKVLNMINISSTNMIARCFLLLAGWYISIIIYYICKKYSVLNFVFYPRKYFNKLLSNIND